MTEPDDTVEPGVPREGEERPAGRSTASRVRLLLSLLSAGVLLLVVFWLADLDELGRRLAGASPGLLGLSLLAYTATYLARARRFAAAGAKASTWTLFWVVSIHGAANRLLPLRTGELSYPLVARRVGAAAMGEGLVQILMLRIVDLLVIALLFLVALGLAVVSGMSGMGQSTEAFLVVAFALVGVSALALVKLGAVLRFVIRLAQWALRSAGGKLGELVGKAENAVDAVFELDTRRRVRIVLWSVVNWGSYFVMFQLILLALGIELPFLRTVLGSSAAIVGSTVPISGVGNFGALEGGWTAGFVAVGLEPATAASTAIVMSGLSLAFAIALAAIGWVALGAQSRK